MCLPFFFRELFPLKMLHKIPIEQMLYHSILPDSSHNFSPSISAYCRNRPEQVLWPSAHFPKTSSQILQENSPSRSNKEIPWSSHSSNRSVSFSICSMSMDRICRQRKFFIFSRLVIVNPPYLQHTPKPGPMLSCFYIFAASDASFKSSGREFLNELDTTKLIIIPYFCSTLPTVHRVTPHLFSILKIWYCKKKSKKKETRNIQVSSYGLLFYAKFFFSFFNLPVSNIKIIFHFFFWHVFQ